MVQTFVRQKDPEVSAFFAMAQPIALMPIFIYFIISGLFQLYGPSSGGHGKLYMGIYLVIVYILLYFRILRGKRMLQIQPYFEDRAVPRYYEIVYRSFYYAFVCLFIATVVVLLTVKR